jgi:hypothetical protein
LALNAPILLRVLLAFLLLSKVSLFSASAAITGADLADYSGTYLLSSDNDALCRNFKKSERRLNIEFPEWKQADNVQKPSDDVALSWAAIDVMNNGQKLVVLMRKFLSSILFVQYPDILDLNQASFLSAGWEENELLRAHRIDSISTDIGGVPFSAHNLYRLDQSRLPRGYMTFFPFKALVTPFNFDGRTYFVMSAQITDARRGFWKATNSFPDAPVSSVVFEYLEPGRKKDICYLSDWMPPKKLN